jgi:3-oxoacyl-[acyl-carrier protein] reductase
LINNAGINKIGEFASIDIDDFDQIIKVNLRAPFLLCQSVIPNMKANQWGRIVNITSIFGHITKECRAPYSSSKFALDGMTAALAAEVSEYGILANSVGPGFIDTDLTRNVLGEKGILELKNKIPMKRLGHTKEIASLVSWLVSEENTYMAGQNIIIDGGFSRV